MWILCNREHEVQEATFFFTGVVTNHSLMPFATTKEYIVTFLFLVIQTMLTSKSSINKTEPWLPPFHQYVVCAMPGLKSFDNVVRAINTTYVIARLRLKEGLREPMTNLVVDGEEAICAMTLFGTL